MQKEVQANCHLLWPSKYGFEAWTPSPFRQICYKLLGGTFGGHLEDFTCASPLKFTPRGHTPLFVAINRGVLQKKNYKMNGFRQTILHTKCRAVCINHLFAAPPHFVGRYVLPGCLISIFFWIWIFLARLGPEPQKRHHFVRTCCSAIYLRFSHSAFNCL